MISRAYLKIVYVTRFIGLCINQGRAWFDEPTAGDTAHDFAPCSNMGECNKGTGICKCREGYSGPACDIRDCDRDENCAYF